MDRLTECNLTESYTSAELNMRHMFKVIKSNKPEIEISHTFSLHGETLKVL